MFHFLQLGFLYLYFPEDKTEYIPVVIELLALIGVCVLLFRWLIKKSNKDAEKAREIETKVMQAKKEQLEKDSTQS
ncbi:hypothetical protein PB01_13745 [Psychrobacillus glaciei]|uniref:Uncharacterized protein n=1 Tax=Psychrobacillus glaciei TaxID=2283160 RepID=A0A5J6SQ68_9BACI|nr:hypothetical protein [Psychrobacillus glaciei]QFF99799.1 hypothetical protein PB01_13745 [Psychrobacillus glaciei]